MAELALAVLGEEALWARHKHEQDRQHYLAHSVLVLLKYCSTRV